MDDIKEGLYEFCIPGYGLNIEVDFNKENPCICWYYDDEEDENNAVLGDEADEEIKNIKKYYEETKDLDKAVERWADDYIN